MLVDNLQPIFRESSIVPEDRKTCFFNLLLVMLGVFLSHFTKKHVFNLETTFFTNHALPEF